ncbi:putative polyketide synthase, partial [Gordonia amarae NBRC 15530]
EIVSEKTGYPADMLGLDMEMEAELGIDSIKQVEILSALQAQYPGAPEIPGSELASMRTLQDVVNSVAGFTGAAAPTETAAAPAATPEPTPAVGLSCTEARLRVVPPAGFAMGGLQDGEVVITREDPAFADALEQVLVTRGIKARAVDEVPEGAGSVISLAALGAVRTPEECVDMHVRAFHAARAVAQSSADTRVFVTIQATGGTFTGGDVPTGIASLVKTAGWEWPNASVRAIDIETLDPERIAAELLAGGSGVEVALRADGTRLVAVEEVDATEVGETIPVPAEGVVVVTGGARGVTARSALALAKQHGLRLALLGRTALQPESADEPAGTTATEIATALASAARARGESLSLPQARAAAEKLLATREVRETLATAAQQGTVAQYFAADTTDREALHASLAQVRQSLGPIVGLVHGAGVLADKRLEDLDDDGFLRVFCTKLIGAENLLAATAGDELRFIALFSSIAARAGNPGQAAYASANAALDSIAAREARRRGDNCVVRAFGWGPWDGGMVDATLKSRFTEAGVGVIPIGEGAEFFARHALGRAPATAVVVAAPAKPQLRSTTLAWDISVENQPALADHQVRGNVVVPVVFALDAMLNAVRGLIPADAPVVRDFHVLSGVTFPAGEQHALSIELTPDEATYAVAVRDAAGRARYSARIDSGSAADQPVSVADAGHGAWPFGVAEAYAGPLFHGPAFQVIDELTTFGQAGGSALLKVKGEAGWTGGEWATDPAALDGALQLGILWASAQGMPLVLPISIGRAVFTAPFPASGDVRCRLAAFPLGDKRVDYDIVFETTDGAPIAALEGVEFYVAGNADGATA